jgi:hypothetical protein
MAQSRVSSPVAWMPQSQTRLVGFEWAMNMSPSKDRISKLLLVCTMLTLSVGVQAQQWSYKKDKEELRDKVYSFAAGFAFDYQYNNDFTVSFICDERKVRFDIDADRLLASKGDPSRASESPRPGLLRWMRTTSAISSVCTTRKFHF